MGRFVEYDRSDEAAVTEFLDHPDGFNIYLVSRLSRCAEGRGFVWRDRDRPAGFAWFGRGRNLVFAGDRPGFVPDLAELAAELQQTWVMLIGPEAPAREFLSLHVARTHRRPRLDRPQTFMVQRAETLPALRELRLATATRSDLPELAAAAARMSAEDFDLDPWRIDREAVRHAMATKIEEDRCFLLKDKGAFVFKADLAVRHPRGGQVEGVFTVEDRRREGLASRAMAEIGHRLLGAGELPLLTLHVATRNIPAVRAYTKAGYQPAGDLRLAILPPAY